MATREEHNICLRAELGDEERIRLLRGGVAAQNLKPNMAMLRYICSDDKEQ
jgi:hypothetical protein